MNTKSQALSQKTLSLAAAGVLAVTACAWGMAQGCKSLAERSANSPTSSSTSLKS